MENQKIEINQKYLKDMESSERLKNMYLKGQMSRTQEFIYERSLDWWAYHYDGLYQVKNDIDPQKLEIKILELEL